MRATKKTSKHQNIKNELTDALPPGQLVHADLLHGVLGVEIGELGVSRELLFFVFRFFVGREEGEKKERKKERGRGRGRRRRRRRRRKKENASAAAALASRIIRGPILTPCTPRLLPHFPLAVASHRDLIRGTENRISRGQNHGRKA